MSENQPIIGGHRRLALLASLFCGIAVGGAADALVSLRHAGAVTSLAVAVLPEPETPSQRQIAPAVNAALTNLTSSAAPSCSCVQGDEDVAQRSPLNDLRAAKRSKARQEPAVHISRCATPEKS